MLLSYRPMGIPDITVHEALLTEVERFLLSTKMSANKFGLYAVGDPRLVYQLRKGREPRTATVREIRSFLRDPDVHRARREREKKAREKKLAKRSAA